MHVIQSLRLLLLLIILCLVLPACEGGYCGGHPYNDVEGVALTPYRDANTVVEDRQSVASRDLVLRMTFKTRGYGAVPLRRGGFSALADCENPAFKEQVDSVTVTSRYAYDAQHPAGASLNDLLTTGQGSALGTPTLSQRLTSPENAEVWSFVELRFQQLPASSGPQQFRLRCHLTNGEVYTVETPVMNVTR